MQKSRIRRFSTLPQRRTRKTLRFSLIRLFIFLIVFGAFYVLIGGEAGFIRIRALNKEKRGLELEIEALKQQYNQLENEKKLLADDTAYIEKFARERLGMIKEGELLFRFAVSDSL